MTAQTSTQAQVISKFGEQKKAFSIDELKRLINAAKNMRDLNQAKGYLCSYFIPCSNPHGVFMWRSEIKNLEHIPDKNINKLIRPITKVFYTQSEQGPSQKVEFNINKWWPTLSQYLSRIPPYPAFDIHFESTTHLAVKFIFFHIQDIWCSGDWNLTEYIIKWLAGVAAGRKMYSLPEIWTGLGPAILKRFLEVLMGNYKDKVTGDIMEIHEKYKMPTHYKNFISTIVFTNENALRVENDDRCTVFLDVSPSRKGDLNYFKKLSNAMKYPGASEAFYAYLRAIADAYPDFNGNPPPMTTSKQDHIISTLPPLFQFIKDTYLIINASRILSNELGINSRKIRVGKATPRVYSISREDLYKKFLTKKWIHETDEINIKGINVETPEKPASDPNALVKFLANIYNPASKSQVDQEEVEPVVEKPAEEKPAPVEKKPTEEKPVSKKTSPPVPLKPDCLKAKPAPVINEDPIPEESPAPIESDTNEPIDSFSDCYLSDEEPDQENELSAEKPAFKADDDYDVLDDLLSDSDFTTVNPAPEQQSESPAESSASVTKPDSEPAPEEQPIPELDTELEPWVKNSKDQVFNDLYNTGKDLWAKYQDVSDEYDWKILVFEVEECPTTRIEDEYQYYLREVVDRFKDWIEYNGNSPKTPSRKELANLIRVYKEDRDAEIIPTTSGYETMKINKGKAREIPEERPKTDMEHEWEAANGIIDDWNEKDTEGAINDIL
ncbi:hypothetical protein GLOIN_2v1880406 [Rhizophagus irregularis DAOM 181602=DAOM 197198]|nr:hypothetical protein GLOIN_2v1880406 [Rhizophagus irregularis DAOM 181602=DAOM 197198]